MRYAVWAVTCLITASVLLSLYAGHAGSAPSRRAVPGGTRGSVPSSPVPARWLQDPQARIAHGLKLPDAVARPVPFDVDAQAQVLTPGAPKTAVRYFEHLCKTEAGTWVFKRMRGVPGLYFARPQSPPAPALLADPNGLEMPWIQRAFSLQPDSAQGQGAWFVRPPFRDYRFVEQPRRDVPWQAGITQPHVHLSGDPVQTVEWQGRSGAASRVEKTPVQVAGVTEPEARYGYTWRGLARPRDREFGIAGGEVLIYDLQTQEVLAVRRQFLLAPRDPGDKGKALWQLAASCRLAGASALGLEFRQFALDVLEPVGALAAASR